MKCPCPFCADPQRHITLYTTAALLGFVQATDEHHKRRRVDAYIELFYRAGVFSPAMPYRVWLMVMGTDVDPPFAKNGIGKFQPPRQPDGTPTDAEWWWWDLVGRNMHWSEEMH